MAKDDVFNFVRNDGTPTQLVVHKKKTVSVNGSQERPLTDFVSKEKLNPFEVLYNIPLDNGEIVQIYYGLGLRVVYNGIDISTGKPHVNNKVPVLAYVLFVLLYVEHFFICKGFLGLLYVFLGIVLIARTTVHSDKSMPKKVFQVILIYLVITVFMYGFGKLLEW